MSGWEPLSGAVCRQAELPEGGDMVTKKIQAKGGHLMLLSLVPQREIVDAFSVNGSISTIFFTHKIGMKNRKKQVK